MNALEDHRRHALNNLIRTQDVEPFRPRDRIEGNYKGQWYPAIFNGESVCKHCAKCKNCGCDTLNPVTYRPVQGECQSPKSRNPVTGSMRNILISCATHGKHEWIGTGNVKKDSTKPKPCTDGAKCKSCDGRGYKPGFYSVIYYDSPTQMIATEKEHVRRPGVENLMTNDGFTPLCAAAQYGHTEVAIALIRAGADVNYQIGGGFTPLYLAIQERNTNVINALIGCTRTNVNLATKDGCTPLYAAAQCGLPEVVKALIRAGADVNHLYDGFTPLDIAEQRRNTESSKPYNKADKNRMFYSGPHAQVVKILKYAVAKRTQDPKWFYSKSDRSKCNVKICQIKA